MKQRRKKPHEKGLAIHSAPSFALGIARCTAKRKQGKMQSGRRRSGNGGSNMDRDASASFCSVWRSRRPHSTPRNFMHENRETSETPAVQPDSRSAGEGLGRTARVYVCEESHCGVVPMNHSNKDKQSSAESGEGRLRLKENAHFI